MFNITLRPGPTRARTHEHTNLWKTRGGGKLFDVTGAALRVGFRANRETLLRTLIVVAETADLEGELTFGTVR